MDTALVLAGTSFVGRHIIGRLRLSGIDVVAATRRRCPGLVSCNITIPEQVDAAIAGFRPRWLIQCAGATATACRAEMDRVHVDGTRNVLRAVARHVPDALVLLFGSAAEYGEVDPGALPIREDHPANPASPFGQSKLAQLQVAQEMARELGLRVLHARPFNVVGPGLPEHYLPAALARRLRNQMIAGQFGFFPVSNAQATRDWVDVRDVADAVARLLTAAAPAAGRVEVYNIASGTETSVLEVAKRLCDKAGHFTAVPAANVPSRSGISRSCGDARRLTAATGWRAQVDWQQSLDDLWRAAGLERQAA